MNRSLRRAAFAAGVLALALVFPGSASAEMERYLVVFEKSDLAPGTAQELAASLGGEVVQDMSEIGVALIASDEPSFGRRMAQADGIVGVTADVKRQTNWSVQSQMLADSLIVSGPPPGTASAPARTPSESAPGSGHPDPTQLPFWPFQWNLQIMGLEQVYAMNQFGDPRVKVAFVATGLDYTHPDLVGKVNLDLSRSFVPEDDVLLEQLFPGAHPVAELGFHATHIASSLTCNLSILACIAPDIDLIGVKVLNKDEFGTIGDVVTGIKYAADIRSHVIALPFAMWAPSYDQWDKVWNWGNPGDRADIIAMIRAIAYAKLKGSVVIADASVPFFLYGIDADADGLDVILPAQAGATTVGCTGSDDTWCNISNYGFTLIDIAAPGGLVPVVPNPPPTTFPPEELVWGACSSFSQFGRLPDECASQNQPQYLAILGPQPAVGHAAGVAALIASRYHGFAHGFFVNWKLLRTAVDIETPGRDAYSGWGRVDAYRGLTQ